MKTFYIKDVFRSWNADEAKDYIGTVGYFADRIEDLEDEINQAENGITSRLKAILPAGKLINKRFQVIRDSEYGELSEKPVLEYFLPVSKVVDVPDEENDGLFKTEDVFTVDNAEQAEDYIGEFGYFGNTVADILTKVKMGYDNVLRKIYYEQEYTFGYFGDLDRLENHEESAKLFIPSCKMKGTLSYMTGKKYTVK